MLEEFLGVLLMLGVAISLASLLLAAPRWFSTERAPTAPSRAPGVAPGQRFSTKFFLAALFFVLLDLEVLLLYPWAALFRELPAGGFVAVGVFAIPVGVGVLYGWRKGALEW